MPSSGLGRYLHTCAIHSHGLICKNKSLKQQQQKPCSCHVSSRIYCRHDTPLLSPLSHRLRKCFKSPPTVVPPSSSPLGSHYLFYLFRPSFISVWTHGYLILWFIIQYALFWYSKLLQLGHWECYSWLMWPSDIFPPVHGHMPELSRTSFNTRHPGLTVSLLQPHGHFLLSLNLYSLFPTPNLSSRHSLDHTGKWGIQLHPNGASHFPPY